ncbi:22023_t:CDS:2, partial [Rhizophagus irregularis]
MAVVFQVSGYGSRQTREISVRNCRAWIREFQEAIHALKCSDTPNDPN